jgi:cbb3-type cytochrome oxidase subunit 3
MKRLFALQAFLLVLFVILLIGWIWVIDPRLEGANEEAARIVAESVTKDGQGRPQLSATPELAELKRRYPNLWFVVRDANDIVLQYGVVPPPALSAVFPRVLTAHAWRRLERSAPPWKTAIQPPGGFSSLPERRRESPMTG